MSLYQVPERENSYLADHVQVILESYRLLLGEELLPGEIENPSKALWEAPFVLLTHDGANDPIFTYANQTAMELFEMTWEQITSLPSRKSAEKVNRKERERLLTEVIDNGFIKNYTGIRISSTGKRFLVQDAIVWNLLDDQQKCCGQAATFKRWQFL